MCIGGSTFACDAHALEDSQLPSIGASSREFSGAPEFLLALVFRLLPRRLVLSPASFGAQGLARGEELRTLRLERSGLLSRDGCGAPSFVSGGFSTRLGRSLQHLLGFGAGVSELCFNTALNDERLLPTTVRDAREDFDVFQNFENKLGKSLSASVSFGSGLLNWATGRKESCRSAFANGLEAS